MIRWVALLSLCTGCLAAVQSDTALLAKHLEKFRQYKAYKMPASEYTPIQREYLKWIDSRMMAHSSLEQMNTELKATNLFLEEPKDEATALDTMFDSHAGYLQEVELVPMRGSPDFLAIKFGIYTGGCNLDETAVLYQRHRFQRVAVLNAEQKYTYGHYLRTLAIGDGNDRLLASAWVVSNCTSNWNGNTFRIDRLVAPNQVENLLLRGVSAFLGVDVKIAIINNAVAFDFAGGLANTQANMRNATDHYKVQGHSVIRQAPIAQSFGGFVDEWLMLPDSEAARWSTPQASARHHEAAAAFKGSTFDWVSAATCPTSPPTREIAIQMYESKRTLVLHISGSTAEQLRMESVLGQPSPSCQPIDLRGDLTSILNEPK